MKEIKFNIPNCNGSEYVLLPSCCYDGNRFDVLKKEYPPIFTLDEAKVDMSVTITDVPRLNKDGSGRIEVTTGDIATPCIGVFSQKDKKGTLLFTVQQIDGYNLGISYQKGEIRITYPYYREFEMYRWPHMVKSDDIDLQDKQICQVEIPIKLLEFEESVAKRSA